MPQEDVEAVVNALGRFSRLFCCQTDPRNPAAAELSRAATALDEAATALAERHGVDYGALVDRNLREGTENPTEDDLRLLLAVNVR